ncbi:MAG TPA: carbamoyltransferase [Bryobacteraceae bacterium]|nr:carbamoyltransferase [Bryobacteraceae bacterium]
MWILGISAFYHDSAAALIRDAEVISAVQEERFTRKKHDAGFPAHAIRYCLESTVLHPNQLDSVVFYEKPFLKFERLVENYLALAPRGLRSFRMALPLWIREKLFLKKLLCRELRDIWPEYDWGSRLLFTEHHQSHAASAFFPSPFEEALVLTMDGVGEWATTSAALGRRNRLEIISEIHYPHSLGLLYSAFTYYTGFKVNSGEHKVMGLAPYGEPKYAPKILDHLMDLKADGSFRLNLEYFDFCTGLTMTNRKFAELFGGPPRRPEERLTQHHMDLAASVQAVLEETVTRMTCSLAAQTGAHNLCIAGGVGLNCVANGKVWRAGRFKGLWVQPACGDAGGALGAALAAYHIHKNQPRRVSGQLDGMKGAYLGPSFETPEIARRLTAAGARFMTLSDADLLRLTVEALVEGKAVGWFQGRMEFGPRALGNRSILGDARSPTMQSLLNLKVKYRESFRPFAPSVLREDVRDWFELDGDSPYMLLVADVQSGRCIAITEEQSGLSGIERLSVPRSVIPAVTHVDYSARVQTVHAETNPRYHALISAFKERTGCPVIVNTSFNIRGEPMACTPEDAFRCFMGTEIEVLVAGNCFLRKEDQDPGRKGDYRQSLEPD